LRPQRSRSCARTGSTVAPSHASRLPGGRPPRFRALSFDNPTVAPYATNSSVKYHWRVDDSWIAVDRTTAFDREFDRSFADEVAIDFPAVADKVERMRHAFVEPDAAVDRLGAEIRLSPVQAGAGAAVPLEVPVRSTCRTCGGRGEVWGEPCIPCAGDGHAFHRQTLTVSFPPGVAHGARFSFSVSPPRGPQTRVDIRVAVA
jgi:hypothetical protein